MGRTQQVSVLPWWWSLLLLLLPEEEEEEEDDDEPEPRWDSDLEEEEECLTW